MAIKGGIVFLEDLLNLYIGSIKSAEEEINKVKMDCMDVMDEMDGVDRMDTVDRQGKKG
jgi:uncharacterized protein (UPF0335 family)